MQAFYENSYEFIKLSMSVLCVCGRIRALSDLETQMNLLRPEYESIRDTASKLPVDKEQHDEMESVWKETECTVAER